jgi:photosystem II PsbM protein
MLVQWYSIINIGIALTCTRIGRIMEVNDLGFVASILFVLVPSVFLLILYIQTASSQANKDS